MTLIVILGGIVVLWVWLGSLAKSKSKPQPRTAERLTPPPFRPQHQNRISIDLEGAQLAVRSVELTNMCPGTIAPAAEQASADAANDGDSDLALAGIGVIRRGDTYHCRGYTFSTLKQALSYARRFDARLGVPPLSPIDEESEIIAELVPTPYEAVDYNRDHVSSAAASLATLENNERVSKWVDREGAAASSDAKGSVASTAQRRPTIVAPIRPTWVSPHETVEIGGVQVGGGLIYVGQAGADYHWQSENCLIDPTLHVSRGASDPTGSTFSYWPAYSGIPPQARRSYVDWLASNRSDPEIGIGYVFIYFYGLERRLFVDKVEADLDLIALEVRRLLSIYGGNGSFRGYAQRLLDAVDLITETEIARPPISPDLRNGWEIPLPVRRYLGVILASGSPLDADDTLLWLLGLPDTYLRTPAVRCFDELVTLWRIRFAQRHPAGLKVRTPKSRITSTYRAASSCFTVDIAVGDLPDIASVAAPVAGLRDILASCINDLDGYSRLLGRKPEAKGSLEAAVCLPPELADSPFASGVAEVRAALEAMLGDLRITAVKVADLLRVVGVKAAESKLAAIEHRQVAGILDRLNIAHEPDRRYSDGALVVDGEAVIFNAEHGCPVDPDRPSYAAARTMVQIAVLAATSDGVVAPEEFDSISNDLNSFPDLTVPERTRLLAQAFFLLRDPPKQQAALNRLGRLPEKERLRTTEAAMAAILADGRVLPAEVRFLEKLHKTLGLPPEAVYAALHRGSVRPDDTVIVAPEEWVSGSPIPVDKTVRTTGIVIDEARLARVRSETSQVSTLLADIFAEDEPTPPAASPTRSVSGERSRFAGLDLAHAKLLESIVSGGSLDRSNFEEQARALRLLPDGAYETINEWGFETFEEPVLEGDEVITTAEHLRDQLRAMEV